MFTSVKFRNFKSLKDFTVVPIGGFSQKQRIQDTAWAFEKILKAEISIAAVLDSDYRCSEETAELVRDGRLSVPHFHILTAKEIENFLLNAPAITKAVEQKLKDRGSSSAVSAQHPVASHTSLIELGRLPPFMRPARSTHSPPSQATCQQNPSASSPAFVAGAGARVGRARGSRGCR